MAVIAALLVPLLTACAAPPAGPAPVASRAFAATGPAAPDPATVWRQLEPLLPAEILLMGEQHDAPEHQQLQTAVVQALAGHGRLAALALEMADRRVRSTTDVAELLGVPVLGVLPNANLTGLSAKRRSSLLQQRVIGRLAGPVIKTPE